MRRLVLALVAAASLGLSAQEAPRFAFFSMSHLVQKSVKASRIATELNVLQNNLQSKGEAKVEEGKKLQAQLQSGSLSEEGREKITKQLRDLQFELKKLEEDGQAELQKVQAKVMGELKQVAGPIVVALAQEQKLQIVFSDPVQQVLAWADESWMLKFTEEVARRLDATEPAGTAAAKPAPKPAPKPAAPAKKG